MYAGKGTSAGWAPGRSVGRGQQKSRMQAGGEAWALPYLKAILVFPSGPGFQFFENDSF